MPATRKVEVAIIGDASSMVRAFRQADSAASGFGRGGSKLMAAGLGAVAGASAVATAAIGRGLVSAVRTGVDEFQAQAKVSAQTAAALKSTGNAAGVTQKQIEDMASTLQSQTGISDDAIQSSENLLLTFNKIKNTGTDKMFDRATKAALDLSVAFHKDLNGSAVMVGKALQDPVKGVTALSRVGVSFSASQKETIKSLVETGQAAKAQKLILGELERQVSGSAQAFGQSTPGQVAKAQRAWEDLTQGLVGAVAPAFARVLPSITQGIRAMAPVLEKAASAIASLVQQLVNSSQFQQFATALRDIAVQGVQILSKALSVLAPIVLAVVAPVAALTAGILNSRAAMTALIAAFAAFATIKVAAKINEISTALRMMATTSGTVTFVQQLGSSLSLLATGFSGVSAKAVGLAPGLTAAQAGLGRVGTAVSIAKTGFKTFASTAMAAVGGPWVLGISLGVAAVTTLATVIGGDLVSSFRGAGSAIDQYRDSLNNAQAAQQNIMSAQAGFESSMLTFAQATRDEAAARRAAADAGWNDAAANQRLSQAMAAVDQARGPAAAGLGNYVQKLRDGKTAVDAISAKLAGAVQPIGLVDRRTAEGKAAWDRYTTAARLAKEQVGNEAPWKAQQSNLNHLSDYLRGLGPQYAGVAREAKKVADMKPGPDQEAALERLLGKLDRIKQKVAGEPPKVKIEANADQAQKVVDNLRRKIDEQLKDKTITIHVNTVESTTSSGGGSKKKGSNEDLLAGWNKLGPAMQSVFQSLRSTIAGAVSGMASMVGQFKSAKYSGQQGFAYGAETAKFTGNQVTGFSSNASLRQKQQDLADRQALRQEKALQDNIARLNADANATQDEKDAAQADLQDFYAQRDIERMQAGVDAQAASDEKAVASLASRFQRGEISAQEFQGKLNELIGGDTGTELGDYFGEAWTSAFEQATVPLQAIIDNLMGQLRSLGPDSSGIEGARTQDNAEWVQWSKDKGAFGRALANAKKNGYTDAEKKALRQKFGADDMAEWLREHPQPKRFARGGIVSSLTNAIIGEAGPEAVIPLDSVQARRMLSGASARGAGGVTLTFNGVLDAKDAARMLRPELDRLVRLAV